jgi:hypothetical protein
MCCVCVCVCVLLVDIDKELGEEAVYEVQS